MKFTSSATTAIATATVLLLNVMSSPTVEAYSIYARNNCDHDVNDVLMYIAEGYNFDIDVEQGRCQHIREFEDDGNIRKAMLLWKSEHKFYKFHDCPDVSDPSACDLAENEDVCIVNLCYFS